MGIFSKLFGTGDPPQPRHNWTEQEARLVALFSLKPLAKQVSKILGDFGDTLADLKKVPPEELLQNDMLIDESKLPHPRKTIEDAFLYVFTFMEFFETDDWFGISKDMAEGAAFSLFMHYAPHVPTDPLAKVEASLERWDQYEKWCHLDRNTRLKRLAEFMVTECRKHNFPYETFTS